MEKAIYPFKVMNITQNYETGNHLPYWKGAKTGLKAYPTDNAGMDGGRDYFRAPCKCKISFLEVKNTPQHTNKMILVSTDKVQTPGYGETQIYFKIVHFLYSDVKKFNLKVGRVFNKLDIICAEGKDNYSTGNHIHMEQGIGYADKSVNNGNGKYVSNGNGKYPQNIFYIDTNYTYKILNDGKIKWKKI